MNVTYFSRKGLISGGLVVLGLGSLGLAPAAVAPARATTVTVATAIAPTPLKWSTTNGDVLDTTVFTVGYNDYVAIGGNFTAVITPDGVRHTVKNFAVLREETGAVVYAGNASSYVRAVRYGNGKLYAGGDFTTFGGRARHYLAAVNTTGWAMASWNPGSPNPVRALEVGSVSTYYGTGAMVRKVSTDTGATMWTDTTTGGAVRALLLSPDHTWLYVGGLFASLRGFANHALARVAPATGTPDSTYRPVLHPNSGVGAHGTFDGQNVLALNLDTAFVPARLIASIGGAYNNLISFSTASGNRYWSKSLAGDGQDTVTIGGVAIVGTHRGHIGAGTDEGTNWFNGAFDVNGGATFAWNARLSGTQSNADGGNNGIQALAQSSVTHRLYVMGAFTRWNQTCSFSTMTCVGGVPLQSIAVYSYVP